MSEASHVELVIDDSEITAELAAALAKAQGEMETVGKDGTNTQNRYNYATADAMIRASRGPLSRNGLAFVGASWTIEPVDAQPGDIGNQFVGGVVTVHWRLFHASGGKLRGTATMDAICSRARPTDKASAATLSYMHGFILRGLLNMDRAEETDDDVDRRDEGEFAGRRGYQNQPPRQQQRPPVDRKEAAKRAANDATGGKLRPASELPDQHRRGDDHDWHQWLDPPAAVEEAVQAGGSHEWFISAWKGLRQKWCGKDRDVTKALIWRLQPEDTPTPEEVVATEETARDMWIKLVAAHKGGEVPFDRIVSEAIEAFKAYTASQETQTAST